jgi:hypothetical protein
MEISYQMIIRKHINCTVANYLGDKQQQPSLLTNYLGDTCTEFNSVIL